ncbi:MAG TPA: Xaa-Pro peptidase family protein [Bryobacteraceae bacterium]|nr:Xaa-Pro peptidase family protein [Bryobacteraceae bacterium]
MLTRRAVLGSSIFALADSAFAQIPAIAALKSRRGEAKPISNEERLARVERAQRLMRQNHLDGIAIGGGSSLFYFSGVRWGVSERLFLMVLPANGDPFFVAPAFEKGRALEQIAEGAFRKSAQIFTWEEDASPYETVAMALKEHGLATGHLGMEERTPFVFASGIGKATPAATFGSATPVTAGCRMIKSANEIALMRLANSVTLEAFEAAWKSLREGMSQREFGDLIAAAHQKLGFPGEADVLVGQYAALPHGSRRPQVIRQDTIVLIDGSCTVEGYHSDITRTFVLGRASDKMKRVFDIVREAQSAARATARPGAACEAVDAAARKVITEAGYGPGYKYFTHRIGHGIGLDEHEWPYLTATNTLQEDGRSIGLAANMTFSDEPGIYIPGEFGIRLEDDMHIGERGAELFTPQSASLEAPFGRG